MGVARMNGHSEFIELLNSHYMFDEDDTLTSGRDNNSSSFTRGPISLPYVRKTYLGKKRETLWALVSLLIRHDSLKTCTMITVVSTIYMQ